VSIAGVCIVRFGMQFVGGVHDGDWIGDALRAGDAWVRRSEEMAMTGAGRRVLDEGQSYAMWDNNTSKRNIKVENADMRKT
jgi:hypothetical protein